MLGQDDDAVVLACLRAEGPGTITVKQLAEKTGLPRVTARTSVAALAMDGLVCLIADPTETRYLVRHLHVSPRRCEEPLGSVIQENTTS